MPAKLALNFTPIATRLKNKDQHPGAYYIPKPHRSHAEMEIRQEEAEKKQVQEEKLQQGLKNVAAIEDALHHEDISREVEHAAKPKLKIVADPKQRPAKEVTQMSQTSRAPAPMEGK
jgi:DNA-directed RNA polymerase subunit L